MKILHLISSLDAYNGGTSEACAGMAIAQAKAGLDIRVLVTRRAGESNEIVDRLERSLGDERIRHVGPAIGPLARHADLAETVSKSVSNADVVHLHGVWEEIQWLGAKETERQHKPFVWAPHGMLDPWSLSQKKWKKRIYWNWRWRKLSKHTAAMHAITRSEARLAAPMFPQDQKVIVESLGHHIPSTQSEAISSNREVLFLSRLHPKKNVECLIQACAAENSDWNLSIAGSGEASYLRHLEEKIRLSRISDRVRMIGDVRGESKAEAWSHASIFCLPSHQENFGIVVIEALAAGLPVLLSPAVGLVEDLSHLPYVRVIDGDAAVWAGEIQSALNDMSMRKQARTDGPAVVRELFSWEQIGRRWVDHYASLLLEHS